MSDTIFALSSGALPAGIAVIRISGPSAFAAAEKLGRTLPLPRQMALRSLRTAEGELVDNALVVRFDPPGTATGEALVELHCHGGRAVVARVLRELAILPGLREAEPGEFTRRAVANGRLDLTEAEGLGDLLAAETEQQRKAAASVAGGALRRQVEQWRDRLLLLAAQAEAAIDYVDEAETELELSPLVTAATALRQEWLDWLSAPRAELLHEGLKVVLAGPANAGKSSLFNALAGAEKAIVTPVPGTTRDLIEARLDLDGIALTLVDTAGIRSSEDAVERIGIERAGEAADTADVLLWLGDPHRAPEHEALILVHAQADQRPMPPGAAGVATSVLTGEGLDQLRQRIGEISRTILPPLDHAPLNRRQAAALTDAADALDHLSFDTLLLAEALRLSLHALDRMTGRQTTEDVLDTLFGRFCLGK